MMIANEIHNDKVIRLLEDKYGLNFMEAVTIKECVDARQKYIEKVPVATKDAFLDIIKRHNISVYFKLYRNFHTVLLHGIAKGKVFKYSEIDNLEDLTFDKPLHCKRYNKNSHYYYSTVFSDDPQDMYLGYINKDGILTKINNEGR